MNISGPASRTFKTSASSPLKSGVSTSTEMGEMLSFMALIVKANWPAPPSGRSSLVTEVTTTCFSPSSFAVTATFQGSHGSAMRGSARLTTAQKPQLLVHTSPSIIKVAVGFEKHSPILGHLADSHTVWRFLFLRTAFISWSLLAGPSFFFAHGGSLFILFSASTFTFSPK